MREIQVEHGVLYSKPSIKSDTVEILQINDNLYYLGIERNSLAKESMVKTNRVRAVDNTNTEHILYTGFPLIISEWYDDPYAIEGYTKISFIKNEHKILATINNPPTTILYTSFIWYKVKSNKGNEGWIPGGYGDYFKLENEN